MDIRIDHPLWLLLLIPIVIYMVYAWKTSKLKVKDRAIVLYILRCLTILCVVLALTVPYLRLQDTEEQVLFVVDRSISIENAGDTADSWIIDSLQHRKSNQTVGIYSFAGGFRTDVQLTGNEISLPKMEPMENRDATNIGKAIDLAASIAKKDIATRIVLLTDGLETDGSLEEILPKYQGERIEIDTVLLSRSNRKDASITKFETPKTAYEGEQQFIELDVESSTATNGQVIIYRNDEEVLSEMVQLDEGKNAFSFKTTASGKGLLKYEAKLIVSDDGFLENNKMLSVTMLEKSPRILVVETEENPSAIPPLLDQRSLAVDVVSAEQLPESLSGYLGYSAVIFDNVPGHLVGEQKMTVIEQAVKKFGVGFMMVGGQESFGLGGYFKSPIERLLPVEMEVKGKEQLPSLGLVIALDRSGSMSGSKIVLAREAAARAVELLRDDDTFGFTAFDHEIWELIPVGPLQKQDAMEKILSIPVGGGTDIFPSVEKAYGDLADLELQRKHIILMTDGQSPMPPDYEEVIEEGKKNNITLTTVAIGSDADGALLEELAEQGGGRFYNVIDESTVPSILTRETTMMTRTYIEDDPFYMSFHQVPEWLALFREGVPQMNAYIATTPKSTATVVAESPKNDPVLAEWSYGLGKTIAFMSDSTGKWSGDLARWERYPEFWNTAISRLLPSYEDVPYMITHDGGGTYTVTDSSRKAAFLDIDVVNEKGEEIPVTTEPLAPGKTRVTLESKPGLVFFGVTDDRGGLFEAGVSVPYSEEFKPGEPNTKLLQAIAEKTGGQPLMDNPAEVFRQHPFKSGNRLPIGNYLLLAAMLLFFIDITIRRFGLIEGKPMKKRETESFVNDKQEESGHVSELLKAKKRR
ncbi:chloride channel protein [Sporosarcina sp. NCCP-2222]|uniref:VWA domain-containing protein n=1 Tax=Sporosarcina sp. NCCP-2222 TaxID=2935073 RepID=UPI00208CD78F|nr:VWA domain-containing protein [Sporosarcina sp. NCCP-2222]GKV55748.1 chloride channel protein [Sporosarcina sp. NCCP-2222]